MRTGETLQPSNLSRSLIASLMFFLGVAASAPAQQVKGKQGG